MRVLVTGSRGYIGSILMPVVAGAGHEVVGLDAELYAGCDFGDGADEFPVRHADVRDQTSSDLAGFDAVLHFAALSNDPVGDLSESLTYEINRDATVRLARAARDAGVRRFVFASSCSMYGAADGDELLDETAPLRPLTAYAVSKVEAEEQILALSDADFAVVSMRNATVYGVSPRLRLDIVLNNLAGSAVATGEVRLLSAGTSWRPLVHVRDLARAAVALLEAPGDLVAGEAINIGENNQNYLVRDLAEILADVSGCSVVVADSASPDPRSYRVDFSAFARMFPSFCFESDARRGAEELVTSYRRLGMGADVFGGRRYIRLRQLRHLLDSGALTGDLRWASQIEGAA